MSLVAPLEEIMEAIVASWSVETCDPSDVRSWSDSNRALGQCVASAFLLHELVGGELLEAEVRGTDGSRRGFHYWNRLPDGTEIDLTLSQFQDGEQLSEPIIFHRPAGPPSHGRDQYRRLAERVRSRLNAQSDGLGDG